MSILLKAELFVLSAAGFIYGAMAVLSLLGAILLGWIWLRGRRAGQRRPVVARALLLCGSLFFGVVLAEATSAAWQRRLHGRTAVPVGGLATTEDSDASWRLPASLEDPNLPTQFPDPPNDRTIDIAVLGESSAEGVPFQKWLSVGKIVAWQLEKAIPARPVRLNVLARSGDTLQAQRRALANLVHRPEILIVYCGHNEFSSRLWWSRDRRYYLDAGQPGWPEQLFDRVVDLSSVCGLIRQNLERCRIALPPSRTDERNLIDVPVYTRVEYTALLTDFRDRLDAIVTYATNIGALSVLIMPPGNDTGYDPNRSLLPAATPKAERAAFARAFLEARDLEVRNPAASVEQYRLLVAAQPGFAETHYRLAQLLEQFGKWDEAYKHYIKARDLDGYPQRMLTAFQSIYRDVASRHDCILIDGQSYFHVIGHHGFLDDELFQDAMHPSFRGQIALAQAVVHALQARRAFGWPSERPPPVIDPAACAAHFGMVPRDWSELCEKGSGFYALVAPLRYETGQRSRKRELYARAHDRMESGEPPESLGVPNIGIPRAVPLVHQSGPGRQRAALRSIDRKPVPLGRVGKPEQKRARPSMPSSHGTG
jgi:lysophospholipase L1-like esterase